MLRMLLKLTFKLCRCGENYLVSGPNAHLLEVCQWISKRLNKTVPYNTLPSWAFKTAAQLLTLKSYFTRKEPAISIDQAQIVCANIQASCEKAQRELQYRNTKTLKNMLEKTYQWWRHKHSPPINKPPLSTNVENTK